MRAARFRIRYPRRRHALLLPLLLAGVLPALAGERQDLTGDAVPADPHPRSVLLVPALKDPHGFPGVLQVSLDDPAEGEKDCAAVTYFPYLVSGFDETPTVVPLRATLAAAPPDPAGGPAGGAHTRGEAKVREPKGDRDILVRVDEGEKKDMDAFVEKLPAAARESVQRALTERRAGVPTLRLAMADPARAGRCLGLIVRNQPPTLRK